MRICEGTWHPREGVTPLFPARIYEHHVDGDKLTGRLIDKPGDDKVGGLFISVEVSSPAPGVAKIKAFHNAGLARDPIAFELHPDPDFAPQFCENNEYASMTTGDLEVRLYKKPWKMEFWQNGKLITRSPEKSLGYIRIKGEGNFMIERLDAAIDETFYGLGERFGPFVKNGQSAEMWNDDFGTWTDMSYKNIPLLVSNRGYALFVNSPAKVGFEVMTEKAEQVQFSVPCEVLEYLFILGPTPKEAIQKYSRLTGLPALPPAWSFGLWLTTSFVTEYNEKIVTEQIDGMLSRGIPLKVFHFDCSWMKDYHWCDFLWNRESFPDPEGMLKRLHEKDLMICVWINPYISQFSAIFEEGKKYGYFLKRPNGDVAQDDDWQPGSGFVDFTNPEAVEWYQSKLQALIDMGVDCFKTDFGECIPTDCVYHDGSNPMEMRNYYTLLYNKAVFELLERNYGKGQAVLFARSATAGSQQYPVHWGGDTKATYESMAEEMRGGLSFMMSGAAFWSHDIGGFVGKATPALYKRWVAWGLMSSHSRLHGMETYRVPWLYDEEAVDVVRHFTRLKNRLMPYIFGVAAEAHQTGTPAVRPMVLEFPDDMNCRYLDRQYMLGSSLLVAPVMNEESVAHYYLPEGKWIEFETGKIVPGGRWLKHEISFLRIPLFVKANSVVAMNATEDRPDYEYADGVQLVIYDIAEGQKHQVSIPGKDGAEAALFECVLAGRYIEVRQLKGDLPWSVKLADVHAGQVTGGRTESGKRGIVVIPDGGAKEIKFRLG